ncbi:MAG: hypothetical protein HYY16_07460, partial [Planctomycetes bacterium]|nr:hypothetical protein [Planctomycetota bacterium]
MSIHERFESMVDLYVAGGLNDAERREASEHTKACAPCGTLLRDAEEFARWVRGTVAPDAPPANLEERVISRWRKGRGRVSRNLRWWRVAGLGVAAGGLILLGNQFVLSSGVRGAAVDQRQEEIARYDEHAPVQLYTASSFSHRGLVAETYEDRKKGVYFVDEIEEKAKNTGRYDGGAGELKENASPVPSSKPPDKSSQDPAAPYQADRKLIYNGTMNLEVEAY